jgi:hypothetical protein
MKEVASTDPLNVAVPPVRVFTMMSSIYPDPAVNTPDTSILLAESVPVTLAADTYKFVASI